jgi:hypothetical protein
MVPRGEIEPPTREFSVLVSPRLYITKLKITEAFSDGVFGSASHPNLYRNWKTESCQRNRPLLPQKSITPYEFHRLNMNRTIELDPNAQFRMGLRPNLFRMNRSDFAISVAGASRKTRRAVTHAREPLRVASFDSAWVYPSRPRNCSRGGESGGFWRWFAVARECVGAFRFHRGDTPRDPTTRLDGGQTAQEVIVGKCS